MKLRDHFKHVPGKAASLILRLELPLILGFLIAVFVTYLKASTVDPLGARFCCVDMLEYIFIGLVIAVACAFFADAIEHDLQNRS